MTDRLTPLGGTDFTSETLASADLNDTLKEILASAGKAGAQNAYQILQANDVFENKDYLAADEMTDSTGTNNTIVTASSTGVFSTDHYECSGGAGSYADATVTTTLLMNTPSVPNSICVYVDAASLLKTGSGDTTDDTTSTSIEAENTASPDYPEGIKIVMNESALLKTVTTQASCTATRALLQDENFNTLETASISSNSATFSGSVLLEAGNTYFITADNSGSSYTRVRDTAASGSHTFSFPIAGTYMDITAGSTDSVENIVHIFNIATVVTETLSGSASNLTTLTLDVSDDAGANYDITAQAITDKYFFIDTSTLTGKRLALRFNLDTSDTDFTPLLYGYGVFVVN